MHAYSYNPTTNPSAENQFFTLALAALRKTNHKTSQTSDQNQTDWIQTEDGIMPLVQSVTSRCLNAMPFHSHHPLKRQTLCN